MRDKGLADCHRWLGAGALLAAAACGDDGGAGGSGGGAAAELTLETCTTQVSADAPAFFRTYFRCVTIDVDGGDVVVRSNGLPPHRSYYYGEGHPNFAERDVLRGPGDAPNPNRIAEQAYESRIPMQPVSKGLTIAAADVDGAVGTSPEEYPMGAAGMALDAVPRFNPLAAPGMDIEEEKYTFDGYEAHPTHLGQYHDHAASPGPLEVMAAAGSSAELHGIKCDGTLALGCTELGGGATDAAPLDAQGGHAHDVADATATHFTARYHVHVCAGGRGDTPESQFYEACAVAGGSGG